MNHITNKTLYNLYLLIILQVLHHYKQEGFDFLLKAFNSPNYLEDLTGLSQLYAQTFDDQVSKCCCS